MVSYNSRFLIIRLRKGIMDNKYVKKLIGSYNKRHAAQFGRKGAVRKFLGPWNLHVTRYPPSAYGNDKSLLSKEEEFSIFSALHFIRYRLTKCKKSDFDRYLSIYIALRNRIISANWRLVPSSVSRMRVSMGARLNHISYDQEALITQGHEALMAAVDKFDPWKGFKLSTYACHSIHRRIWRELKKRTPIPVSFPEIATEMEDTDKSLWLEQLQLLLRKPNYLDTREANILFYRFAKSLTLKQTGLKVGITQEGVRQIQLKITKRIRKDLNQNSILNNQPFQNQMPDKVPD